MCPLILNSLILFYTKVYIIFKITDRILLYMCRYKVIDAKHMLGQQSFFLEKILQKQTAGSMEQAQSWK